MIKVVIKTEFTTSLACQETSIKTETRKAQQHFMKYKPAIFNLIYHGLANLKNVMGLGGDEISDKMFCIVKPIHGYSQILF